MRFSIIAFTLALVAQSLAVPHTHASQLDKGGDSKPPVFKNAHLSEAIRKGSGKDESCPYPCNKGKPKENKLGSSPEDPFFVKTVSDDNASPVFPSYVYIDARKREILTILVGNIIAAQKQIQKTVPRVKNTFEDSIESWNLLLDLIPEYKTLRDFHFTKALQLLLLALRSLTFEDALDAVVSRNLWYIVYDSIFLVGWLNRAFYKFIFPAFITDGVGEVYGATLHVLKPDVTNPLYAFNN